MSETAEAAVPSPQPTSEETTTTPATTTATTTETLATGTTAAVAEPTVETVSEATEMEVETATTTTTETMPKTVPETSSKESGKSSRKRNRSPSPTTTAAGATGPTTTTTTTTLDGNGMAESGKEEEAAEEPSRKKKKMVDATAKPIPSSSLTTTTEAAGAAEVVAATTTATTTTEAEPAATDMEIGEEMTEEEKAASLEIQDAFTTAATKLLDEKLAVLDAESTMIEEGTHDEFVGQVAKYKKARDEKVKLAEAWRNLQMENINNVYQAEIAEAETHYASFQNTIRKTMLDAIAEKRKSIEEEKAIHMGDAQKSSSVRTLRKRGAKGGDGAGGKGNDAAQDGGLNNQGVGAPGSLRNQFPPGISRGASYALQENDIREDLYLIQKSIYGRSGPTGYPSVPTPMVTSTTSTTQ